MTVVIALGAMIAAAAVYLRVNRRIRARRAALAAARSRPLAPCPWPLDGLDAVDRLRRIGAL